MSLSDKITKGIIMDEQYEMIFTKDVKDFIKALKKSLHSKRISTYTYVIIIHKIDTLAGEKLI